MLKHSLKHDGFFALLFNFQIEYILRQVIRFGLKKYGEG